MLRVCLSPCLLASQHQFNRPSDITYRSILIPTMPQGL